MACLQVLKERGADPSAGLNTRAKASEKTVSSVQEQCCHHCSCSSAVLRTVLPAALLVPFDLVGSLQQHQNIKQQQQ
jgi:hypothetical protein